MKAIGMVLLVIAAFAFDKGFSMDTSVATELGGRRVHNIGLMNDKQNIIIFAGVLAVIGTLLFALAGKNKQSSLIPESANSSQSPGTRKCPFCAELVKAEAVICRFCQKDLPPVPEIAPTPDITESNSTHLPSSASIESLTSEQIQAMEEFGITYDGEKFHFHEYRYERLTDAVDYAKLQAGKK